uniref:RRP7 domain-containing protein n=1 Tax=Macrostomum lignano TaxID=282301 RepID=A0A1I8IRI5_9PLAT
PITGLASERPAAPPAQGPGATYWGEAVVQKPARTCRLRHRRQERRISFHYRLFKVKLKQRNCAKQRETQDEVRNLLAEFAAPAAGRHPGGLRQRADIAHVDSLAVGERGAPDASDAHLLEAEEKRARGFLGKRA